MNGQRRIGHFRHLYRLLPLKSDRAVEMVLHAYNYVRVVDPDPESGAAELLWTKYKEMKRK